MYNDYLVTSDMSHVTSHHAKNTKKQIFLERAFQIEHNTAWVVLYGFPSQKSTFFEPALCGAIAKKPLKHLYDILDGILKCQIVGIFCT